MERMHDLSYFRANFERIAERLATRGNVTGLDQFRELDHSRRAAITQAEQLKARVNEQSAEIGKRRREGADTTEQQEQVRAMKAGIAALDEQVQSLDASFQELLAGIPNVPHESVPVGKSADDNVEVRRVGEPPSFDFEPKAHWDLGPELGILDFERAAKITGARFAPPPCFCCAPRPRGPPAPALCFLFCDPPQKPPGARFALYWDLGLKP